jgi:MFS family permease
MAMCSLTGKLVVGFLADRIDNRYLYLTAAACVIGGAFLLLRADSFKPVLLACCLLGFAAGGVLPLRGNIYATTFSAEALGRALGLAAPFTTITASGPIIAAKLRDASGSYDAVFIAIMCVLALAGPVMLLLPRRKPAA